MHSPRISDPDFLENKAANEKNVILPIRPIFTYNIRSYSIVPLLSFSYLVKRSAIFSEIAFAISRLATSFGSLSF